MLLAMSLVFSFSVFPQTIALQLNGKSGAELRVAIATSRPTKLVTSYTEAGGAWEAFRITDNNNGYVIDRFSNEKRLFASDGVSPVDGMTVDQIVNLSWWGSNYSYGDTIKYDLHHLIPCDDEVTINKRDYSAGEVQNVVYDNGTWRSGTGTIAGVEANVYEPADEYKGDFARAIMYIATLYPADRWSGLGINFMQNNKYPILNKYAQRILLAWHRSDPVSDTERRRNDAVQTIQGNRNLFIDYPQLAEHLWGTEVENTFDTEVERVSLRSTYRLGDERIDLYHQKIPEDVVWTVDGATVPNAYLIPAELGLGIHELRYSNSHIKGKLKIQIVE